MTSLYVPLKEVVLARPRQVTRKAVPQPLSAKPNFPTRGSGLAAASKRKMGGVHNVHTLAVGLGRTSAGLGRTRHVFGSSQCLQGLEAGSSPTSGTADPLVGGVFCFNVMTKLALMRL